MPAYVITKSIWDAVVKTAVTDRQVSGLEPGTAYVVVDHDADCGFQTLEAAPVIEIAQAPTIAGLEGLAAGTSAADVLAAWTGQPTATVSDGSEPGYAHEVRIDGVALAPEDLVDATAALTIATTISANGAEDVTVQTDAVTVAAAPLVDNLGAASQRNADNPEKIDVVYANALPAGFAAKVYIGDDSAGNTRWLTQLDQGVTFTTNGSFPDLVHVRVYIFDEAGEEVHSALVATIDALAEAAPAPEPTPTPEPVLTPEPVPTPEPEPVPEPEPAPVIEIAQAPTVAGLEGLAAGTSAADVLAAWTGQPTATVSDGSEPGYAHEVRIDGVALAPEDLVDATATLTIATTISANGAEDVTVQTDAVTVAAAPLVDNLGAASQRNADNPEKIDVVYAKALPAGFAAKVYIGDDPAGNTTWLTQLDQNVTFTTNGSFPDLVHVRVYIFDEAGEEVHSALVATIDALAEVAPAPEPTPTPEPEPAPEPLPTPEPAPPQPETDSYTLAQVEALRTDGTTRGVPIGTVLKDGATEPLPAGMSRSGNTISVASDADIASLDSWDFSGFRWIIKGRIRSMTRCLVRYDGSLTTGVIDLYPTAQINLIDWCSFLGAGYSGGFSATNLFFVRTSGSTGPSVDVIDHCDFFGWGGDVIKSTWGGVIQRCYFDTPINLPAGTKVWSASANYAVNDYAVSPDKRYAYRSLTGGSGKALPSGKTSNSDWQNYDPHSDTLNPFYQFGEKLLIKGVYINRLEATRAVDPGSVRAVGINNGIRAIRNNGTTSPMNEIEVANVVVTKSELNLAYPVQLADLDKADTAPTIFRDSWIGSQSGGGVFHPGTSAGHTIYGITEYTNSTEISASYGDTGTVNQADDPLESAPEIIPEPAPEPVVDDPLESAPEIIPEPAPDPAPQPKIDASSPAIVVGWAQSEPAFVTSTTYTSGTPRIDATGEALTVIWSNGAKSNVGDVQNIRISQATQNQVSPAMVHLNNALHHIAPGKPFVLGVANEEGTSRVYLGAASGDRRWSNTKAIVDEIYRNYPQGPDRATEYWWASDIALIGKFPEEFSPLYFGQWSDGRRFNFGDVNTDGYRKQTVDNCFWDYETSDPSQKGRGLLPRTVPFDLLRKDTWGDDARKVAGVQRFVDDERFQALGGVFGHTPNTWIRGGVTGSDGSHPHMKDPEGHVQAAYEFYMPSLLRAAGIPIQEPKFTDVYTAPDGSYADVAFHAPNGGVLSTPQRVRGGTVDTSATYAQEIWGFIIKRASGGGRVRIARMGASGIPTKYQGTVTRHSDDTARIVMREPLQTGDQIIYIMGLWGLDSNYPRRDQYGDGAHYYRCLAIEHIPAYTDTSAVYPFAGFNAKTHGPEWSLVRGG